MKNLKRTIIIAAAVVGAAVISTVSVFSIK